MDRCTWQTAYGLPWDRYCGEAKQTDAPFCDEHIADFHDLYPDQTLEYDAPANDWKGPA